MHQAFDVESMKEYGGTMNDARDVLDILDYGIAQAGLSYLRFRSADLGLEPDFYEAVDIHVHIPEGAIPKDGPSAGITMACAIASALTGKPVRHDLAMTGEITLRGRVLPVGGVKEKVLAAHRAGVSKVILPLDNKKDLEDIPSNVREDIDVEMVSHMDQVLAIALADVDNGELGAFACLGDLKQSQDVAVNHVS